MGRVFGIMKYPLLSRSQLSIGIDPVAGVRIPIKAREITAGDIHSDTMACLEYMTRRPEIYREFVYLTGTKKRGVG